MELGLKPGKVVHLKTQFNAKTRPPVRQLRSLVVALALAIVTLGCSTGGGYWLPPSSTDTPPPDYAYLLGTQPPAGLTPISQGGGGPPGPDGNPVQNDPPVSGEAPAPLNAPTDTPEAVNSAPILYYVQAADTLPVVAVRFNASPDEITSPDPIPPTALLNPNQLLVIPRRLANTTSSQRLLADSEVVYSPSATDFNVEDFVNQAGGYLSTYTEWLKSTGTTSGAEIVQRVALENSINPRLLLALLEYESGWVYGQPTDLAKSEYPMGYIDLNQKGLFHQLVWAVNHISVGYYSWREGRLTELHFSDGITARLAPDLNAGSVALQYYFAQIYDGPRWVEALDLENGFPALHQQMFGNSWARAQTVEPLYPTGLEQPQLSLPFQVGYPWYFSGGPHGAWEHEGSYAALDFAPGSTEHGCAKSNAWVTASASGLVVRSGNGVVVVDFDGDGYEQTGWVMLYLHVSSNKRVPVGTWVDAGDPLGHPSCEGGMATGTHVHIARKYNGEWIAADGPMPFVLSGWRAHAGVQAYKGSLTRGDEIIEACTCGSQDTRIVRTSNETDE
jgi:LasA protease